MAGYQFVWRHYWIALWTHYTCASLTSSRSRYLPELNRLDWADLSLPGWADFVNGRRIPMKLDRITNHLDPSNDPWAWSVRRASLESCSGRRTRRPRIWSTTNVTLTGNSLGQRILGRNLFKERQRFYVSSSNEARSKRRKVNIKLVRDPGYTLREWAPGCIYTLFQSLWYFLNQGKP